MRLKSVLIVLLGSMLMIACSLSSEEMASLAAKGYYEHLIHGEYEQYLEGKDGLDRQATEDYWNQLLDNCNQFVRSRRCCQWYIFFWDMRLFP